MLLLLYDTIPRIFLSCTKRNIGKAIKNEYHAIVKRPRDDTSNSKDVQELPSKKTGRPLLLGNDLDKQVREYVKYLRERNSAVNTAVVIAAAEGIIINKDASLLSFNALWWWNLSD